MATMSQLSRRLDAGREMKAVVETMKGMAAVSIQEYERAVEGLREYTQTVQYGMRVLLTLGGDSVRTGEKVSEGNLAALIIGTDQGLCGPLNQIVVDHALDQLAEKGIEPDRCLIAVMGTRALQRIRQQDVSVNEVLRLPGSVGMIAPAVQQLLIRMDSWRDESEVGRVLVFHQRPLDRSNSRPVDVQVIPPDLTPLLEAAERPWPTEVIPDSPHSEVTLLRGLIRESLFVSLFQAIAEARAAEHGARLTAMQSAEQNIEDQLDSLQNRYLRARQAEITQRLQEVVAGYEAAGG